MERGKERMEKYGFCLMALSKTHTDEVQLRLYHVMGFTPFRIR